jgi:outer membrane protein OmpA-like peptidoglycan-associated protein
MKLVRGGIGFQLTCGVAVLSLSVAACSSSKKVNNAIAGAIVGAGIGAAAGTGVGDTNSERGEAAGIGAGIGAILGGIIGYTLTKEPPPPPPPPPPPRAAPAPAPAAPPPAESKRIVLRGVNFDFDKSNIKSEFAPILDEAAQILKDNPNITVTIEGHTDSIGSEAYNQRLSERRAKAVKQYLVSRGVEASRLETIGKGESEPIADNTKNGRDNPEGRAMNRRAELKVN